jgi:spore germination protein GerM
MRTVRIICVAALLLGGIGCAREGEVRILSPNELPQDLYAKPTPSPTAAPLREVRVWFVREGRLSAATRRIPSTAGPVATAVQSLLAGPTPEEEAGGLGTAVPRGAELLDVSLADDLAEIDLSKEFEASAEQPVFLLRIGQVVYTATELNRVSRVRFLIDGEPVNVIGQDGTAHQTVTRGDYASLAEPVG